jgi:hypothetical protein
MREQFINTILFVGGIVIGGGEAEGNWFWVPPLIGVLMLYALVVRVSR